MGVLQDLTEIQTVKEHKSVLKDGCDGIDLNNCSMKGEKKRALLVH